MKFSCTKDNLNQSLQIVSHVATKQTNLPILQNVLLQVADGIIKLFTTNLEIGIRVIVRGKVETAGNFTLPAQLFANYINLLTTERVDCVLNGNELAITSEQQQTIMKGLEATDFPVFPEIDRSCKYIINKQRLQRNLQQVIIASALDETRPEIAGVLFWFKERQLILAATDSYRLAEKKGLLEVEGDQEYKVILPYAAAQELLRILEAIEIEQVDLFVTEHQLACVIKDIEFVSRLVEGNFPEYQQIISLQGNTVARLLVKQLIKAIKGAALFSRQGINDVTLTVNPDNNTIEIKAANMQLGDNTIMLAANIKGQAASITFNYRYMLEGLQQIDSANVNIIIIDEISPVVLQAEQQTDYAYVIMPIKQ
ncbi:MAG: DNA polymerase III subunit beta [Patescibacteria group bacterium]|jgi:DNA polymerase-3 subunit beta